jgi:hypothetical protein
MTKLWETIKKYPCASGLTFFLYMIMVVRVQGHISTLVERTLVNFISGVAVVTIVLYVCLYITGSLNPGDKPLVDFKGLAEKLLKGKSADQSH